MKKKICMLLRVLISVLLGFVIGFFVAHSFVFSNINYNSYYQTGKSIASINENWKNNFCYRLAQDIGVGVDVECSDIIIIRDRNSDRNLYFDDNNKYEHNKSTGIKTRMTVDQSEFEAYFSMIEAFREEVQFILKNDTSFERVEYLFEKSIPTIELTINNNECKKIDFLSDIDSAKIRMSFNDSSFRLEYEKKTKTKTIGFLFGFFYTPVNSVSLLPSDLSDYVELT